MVPGLRLLLLLAVGCQPEYKVGADGDEPACPEEVALTPAVSISSCHDRDGAPVVEDPWRVRTLWTVDDPCWDAVMPPVVGPVRDTNGDGSVGEGDVPAIVVAGLCGVVAFDGATGAVLWEHEQDTHGFPVYGLLVADAAGEGGPEVVAGDWEYVGYTAEITAFALDAADGSLRWRSDAFWHGSGGAWPSAVDLDRDGEVEILWGSLILDGTTGALRLDLPEDGLEGIHTAVPANIDVSGNVELLIGGLTETDDGEILWDALPGLYDSVKGAKPLALQADEDSEAEVAWLSGGYSLWEHNGLLISTWPAPGSDFSSPSGTPCAADLDGNGTTEIAWTGTDWFGEEVFYLSMMDVDGTVRWRTALAGEGGYLGCAAFDFDGDGAAEVAFQDRDAWHLIDGATGSVLVEVPGEYGEGRYQSPVVADVDVDGHADLVVVGSGSSPSVAVWSHDGDGWAPAGPDWGQVDYVYTNSFPDGHIPAEPEPSWLSYNLWRSRPTADTVPRADLVASSSSSCDSSSLVVRVVNQGLGAAPAGALLVAWAGDEEVGSLELPEVPAHTALDGLVIEGAGAADRLVIDAGDAVYECDEGNNEAVAP